MEPDGSISYLVRRVAKVGSLVKKLGSKSNEQLTTDNGLLTVFNLAQVKTGRAVCEVRSIQAKAANGV